MNTHTTLTDLFTDIADAIREKTGSTAKLAADDFPDEIGGISTGGPLLPKGVYRMKNILSTPAFVPVTTGAFGSTTMVPLYNTVTFQTTYGIGFLRKSNTFTLYQLLPDGNSTGNTWYDAASGWPAAQASHTYRVTADTAVSQDFLDWFLSNVQA